MRCHGKLLKASLPLMGKPNGIRRLMAISIYQTPIFSTAQSRHTCLILVIQLTRLTDQRRNKGKPSNIIITNKALGQSFHLSMSSRFPSPYWYKHQLTPFRYRTSSAKYICLYEECDGEFSRLHDLKRHVATHHPEEARWIDCKGKGCGRTGKPQPGKEKGGFSRLDHYLEHLRKVHKKDIPKGRGSGKGVKWVSASVYAEQGEFPCKREVMV